MIIQEISFGMSVEVYPSQWRKASVKGVVGERESDAEALTQAKTFLEDWFNKAYSLPPDANKVYTTGDAFNNTVINREDERLNDLIADCTTLDQLAKYKESATKQGMMTIYMNKAKQLSK